MGSVLLGTGGRVGPQCAPSLLRGQSRPGLCWSCVSRPHGQQYASVPRRRCQRLTKQVRATAAEPGMGLSEELKLAIDKYVSENKVVLFMKGNRQFPQCGFSNTCVQILNLLNVPYETVNILEDERLRSGMKEYSQWPTFPQVYIGGEFFGGCDIMIEAYQNGQLVEVLEAGISS